MVKRDRSIDKYLSGNLPFVGGLRFDIWCANCGAHGYVERVEKEDDFLCSKCEEEFREKKKVMLRDAAQSRVGLVFYLPPKRKYNSRTGERIES